MPSVVGIDDDLYLRVVNICNEQKINFPTIKNFIDKAVKEKLDSEEVKK